MPNGRSHNSFSGHADQVVQLDHAKNLIIVGRPIRRRRRTVIISVAVTVLIIALLVGLRWHAAEDAEAVVQHPLAVVTSVAPVECRSGWVVPGQGQTAAAARQDATRDGVLTSDSNVTVTVQGVSGQTVVLQSMTVIVVRRAPSMPGLYVPSPCWSNVLPPRPYVLDLDSPAPRLVPQPGTAGFPYTVNEADPEQFVISPVIAIGDVQWRLDLTWTSGATQGQLVIDDAGKPFNITARCEEACDQRSLVGGLP